ncbi:hypothetical protein [Peptostreptococcus faecalis]|uniref:hypothetical protein n=1 Tax=Peptostreptococcus faecalis TaxID=2045015 RepID=UPI000C7CE968|nr:hypothetical protein [Peptostreptococcus faecalis]
MNLEILLNQFKMSFIYTTEFVLMLLVFGVIFNYVEKKNSSSIYRVFGFNGLIITGLIGTVIHEFSHILFCIIFRHRILDYSLFRPYKSRYDGVMGYVNHSCNTRSLYQMVGNFFIGIAPIIFGITFLILSMWILLPNEFHNVFQTFNENMTYMANINSIKDSINIYITIVLSIINNLNPFKSHNYLLYIIFIYIAYSVTTHMDLSKEDINNSKVGFFVFFATVYLVNFIFLLLGIKYQIFLLKVTVSIISFLTVGLLFAIITMLISNIIEMFLTH